MKRSADRNRSVVPDVRPVLVASHPRSGTHLLIDVLRRQFAPMQPKKWWGEGSDRLYLNLDLLPPPRQLLDARTARRILARSPRPILKSHYFSGLQRGFFADQSEQFASDWLRLVEQRSQVIYIYRDARDCLRSLHHFMQGFDQKARCSLASFIRQEEQGVSRIRLWAEHVEQWLAVPDVLPVRYEDLLRDSRRCIEKLGEHLELVPLWREPFLPNRLRGRWHGRFNRLFRRQPDSTAILGRCFDQIRPGAYSAEDLRLFEAEVGDSLTRLGYDSSKTAKQENVSPPRAPHSRQSPREQIATTS